MVMPWNLGDDGRFATGRMCLSGRSKSNIRPLRIVFQNAERTNYYAPTQTLFVAYNYVKIPAGGGDAAIAKGLAQQSNRDQC